MTRGRLAPAPEICECHRWAITTNTVRPIANISARLSQDAELDCLAESTEAKNTMATITAAWNCHAGPLPKARSRARTKHKPVQSRRVIPLSRTSSKADSSSSNRWLPCATSSTGVERAVDMNHPSITRIFSSGRWVCSSSTAASVSRAGTSTQHAMNWCH